MKTFVIVLGILVLAGLAGLVVYNMGNKTPPVQPVTEVTTPAASPTPVPDTSDAGLAKDSADIDAKLKAADQDFASIDAGLNDKQGNLSEQ